MLIAWMIPAEKAVSLIDFPVRTWATNSYLCSAVHSLF